MSSDARKSIENLEFHLKGEGDSDADSLVKVDDCKDQTIKVVRLFNLMRVISRDFRKHNQTSRYYFRGEPSDRFPLLPGLLRSSNWKPLRERYDHTYNPVELQTEILKRYRRYTQHLIHADRDYDAPIESEFDLLCMAQHLGLPTLLLDWSLNPYVAIYFAISELTAEAIRLHADKAEEPEHDLAIRIWVSQLKPKDLREPNTIYLDDRSKESSSKAQNWINPKIIDAPAENGPALVVPLAFTRRIASQSGRFMCCRNLAKYVQGEGAGDRDGCLKIAYDNRTKKHEKYWPLSDLYAIDVCISPRERWGTKEDRFKMALRVKQDIVDRLEFIGFHAGRVYPDLVGWARYLAEGNL